MSSVLEHGVVGCCKSGPGYATPLEAMSGPRESLIYVTAVYTGTTSLNLFLINIHILAFFFLPNLWNNRTYSIFILMAKHKLSLSIFFLLFFVLYEWTELNFGQLIKSFDQSFMYLF